MVLGRLQDDPDNGAAWNELAEAVTAPDREASADDVERLLGAARAKHEQRREWGAVARLLELEMSFSAGTPVEVPMQAELARIFNEELADPKQAAKAYARLAELQADHPAAGAFSEIEESQQATWRDVADEFVTAAGSAEDDISKSSFLTNAANLAFRYGRAGAEARAALAERLEEALRLDPSNRRAATLAELLYTEGGDWESAANIQAIGAANATDRDDRIAAALRLGKTFARKLSDQARAVEAYQQVLDLAPGQPEALAFLSEAYSTAGAWEHLVALYEDQLRGGGVKPSEELGALIQIAMVHWRMREQPAAADPYFERVRKADPTHAGMLGFFREYLTEKGDKARLSAILSDAQRATPDGPEKRALATEIAVLAESQENAQKAIDQYKALLRQDPENRVARDALKRLYTQTEAYNPLIDLHKQELDRTTDPAGRAAVLREIAAIYRERVKNDAALVTVLTQLLAIDEHDIDAIRELTRVYEALGRWRDLLTWQQKLAELSTNPAEKANLYRAVARRWVEQFSNVQNAVSAYEGLLDVDPTDVEAQQKLKELYQKRRAWPQLYTLFEKQLPGAEGAAKIELLSEMARLAAERLDKGADAIALYKQILDIDPAAPGVLDALEKQAERDKDFATVAEVLEKRVDMAFDEPSRLAALQKLGAVYAERLKDPVAAARTWRRVLALSPGHAKALRVLRESYVASGDWDGLEDLYASQNDYEGLVDFLSTAADKAADPAVKLDISFRAARVFEQELRTPERAARSYERVLSVSPQDARAAAALVPIYEKEEKWARLPALYEILLAATSDVDPQVALLRKLAQVTGGSLSDKSAALHHARRAYELSPDEEGLTLLESWSRAAGSWGPFVEAVLGRLRREEGLTPELKRSLRLKLAEVYARELGKLDEAVAVYRELVESDPSDVEAVQALDAILRANNRKDDLRWLFELRARQVEGEDRADIYEEWASLEEEVFGDPAQAITLLRRVVELVPSRGSALRQLARLLISAGEFEGAADVLVAHRDVSEGQDRARREVELATLYLDRLDRPGVAFEASVRALEIAAHDQEAVAILSRLVERPETRVRAASVLEAEYAETGNSRRQAAAIRVMLEAEADPERRKELWNRLADVEEQRLNAPGAAFDAILKALPEFSSDIDMWDRAASLAGRAGRPIDLAGAYRAHIMTAREEGRPLPDAIEVELCERAASLHDEQLGDPEGAKPYLARVLAVDPTNARAFGRLKQILMGSEKWSELEELYDKRVASTEDPAERIELLSEIALASEEIMGNAGKAIGYYERILALDSFHEGATSALERLYEREGRWADLAALLERRLETSTQDESLDIRLTLGRIYLDRLSEPEKALGHLEDVLGVRVNDSEARHLVERILEVPALRLRAARVLEAVYEAKNEIRQLVRVLEILREGATDEAERRDLLRRVSLLRDERLRDDPGAFAALSELVPLEPEDESARVRFIEIGRRLGEHERVASVLTAAADACMTLVTRGAILMEVARICEDLLGDVDRAEKVYRRVLEIDPADPTLVIPAARALGRIYAARQQHAALADVLNIEVRLEENVDARRALYERIGTLYETVLDNPAQAIEAWRSRLGDDPADEAALRALERLYERTSQWRELVEVLRARESSSTDPAERRRTMVRAAETLAGKLDDVPEAISAWRSVFDDFGADRATLAALEALYEKAERWTDLADALETDLPLAEDVGAQLDLYARLGDVRRLHQNDLTGALDAYRQALLLDPGNVRCRAALESMLDNPDARRDAAEILRPLYEMDGDAERLLRVLDIEVETSDDVSARLQTLSSALRTAEGPLGDPARAFGYALRGLREAAGEAEVDTWIKTVERLAATTGKWTELTEIYQAIAPDILDGDVQQSVRLRMGELARTRLGNRELAVEHYKQALDARADDRRAMIALEELYGEAGDSANLLEILKVRVDNAQGDEEKKKLLFRIAELQRGPLSDKSGAIETYEAILDVGLEHEAISALEALYRESERYADLIGLYERQLFGKVGNTPDLHVKIAIVAHKHTGDVPRAFDELGSALGLEPSHPGAVAELEHLLETSESDEHKARAGEMLEPVYLRRADWARVKVALDARLKASQDPSERGDLLRRLATLHEEQLEDYKSALETVAMLFHEDITDETVWVELERLAKVASAERRLADIYAAELTALTSDDASSAKLARRTGEIFAELGDIPSALTWYRRAHEFEPESRELFDAIDRLLVREKRHEERVELYRSSLDYRYEKDRLHSFHTIASLERVELKQPEKAIETYRSALDVDDNDAVSLDALTELYRELGRDRDLADLYLRRAESASGGEAGAPYRLALARLLRDKLEDTSGAIDQLEAIVNEVPWHADAIQELENLTRNDEHKARVVEILRPLYERADDWKLLVRLNEERFGLAQDPREQVAVLRETAKLWATRGGDAVRAFQATSAAFEIDPEDTETRVELERLAELLGAWEELAGSYELGVAKTEDETVKRELLLALAKLYDERADDPRRALDAYRRLSALDERDPEPLEAIDTLALLLADWQTIIAVLEKKSEIVSDDENAAIWRRIAQIKLQMLDDTDGAIAAYERALELDPESTATFDALIDLYEPRDQAERLVELYQRRVELAGPAEADLKYGLNVRSAERYEKLLKSPRDAITSLLGALDARPGDPTVLTSLERLYRSEEMWDELLENLKLQVGAAGTKEDRIKLRTAIGDLFGAQLESPSDALEQYRFVFEDAPADDHAIKAVWAIGEAREELRLDAANILEPVLRSAGRFEELASALELRLRAQTEPEDRARTLRAIAMVQDEELKNPEKAETALLRALEDTPSDASLHAEIERLCERSGGYERYCDALAQRAGAILDAEIAKDLYLRIGRIAEEKLKDDRRSVEAYAKAVEHAGDTPELLTALDRLYGRLGDMKALADVLDRRVTITVDEKQQADFYYRLAVIQIGTFNDKAQGLATLRQALERAPEHKEACEALEALTDTKELFEEAAEALENVYRVRNDHAALARLYEKRIRHAEAPGERVRMRLDLAKVLEERSGDPRAAQAALEAAFTDDPTDLDVLTEIERLAPMTHGFPTAADALEKAVRAKEDLTSDTARDLWVRIAGWRKDKISDAAGAERAFEEALKHDASNEEILRQIEGLQRAPGREKDLVGTLRRLAALDSLQGQSGEIRREAKRLAETSLGDDALAEAILRDMIAADESDTWALAELAKLREKAGDFKEVFSLLVRQAELLAEADKVRELRHAAATVAREKLSDDAKAIELYDTIFEDEPTDTRAATALRELYAKTNKPKELLKLLSRLIDLAESPEARSTLRLESAQICLEKLDAIGEATEHLRAVLDEDPSNERATKLLAQLLEKTGRDQELADLFASQIDLAKERSDVPAELSYSVRLGEVYETRLNDVPKAIDTYKAVLERDARQPGALRALAKLFEQKGEKAEAAKMLETILEDATGEEAVKTALRLADLYTALKDQEAVRRVLERGLKADPSAAEIRKRLLALYEKSQAWAELADLITGNAAMAPTPAEKVALYRKAADIHTTKRKDPGSAADLLVKASELQPNDRELMLALCDAYSDSGRGKQSAEVLQKIVESFGGRRSKELVPIHHRLAKAYIAENERDKALGELDIAFKIDPGSVTILRELGVLSLDMAGAATDQKTKEGHIERAAKTFRALLLQKLDEGSPISKGEVFYYLADISHRQGDDKKALQMVERSLDSDKNFGPAKELLAKLKTK
jgi:tetratricopeptide (TPR) repeat protein